VHAALVAQQRAEALHAANKTSYAEEQTMTPKHAKIETKQEKMKKQPAFMVQDVDLALVNPIIKSDQ
jgi:hypothetical protein